jgi:hypothetical protein
MKAFRLLLILSLLVVALGIAASASAGAFTYTSGFQVQNLEASAASITVTFYNQDGTKAAEVTDSVAANGSKTYFPLTQVSDGFNGSVVISSDKQVAAIGNVLGDSGLAAASYSAANAGATTVLLPLLMKDNSGFNTWFNVQNTGGSDATVSVAYSDGTSANATIKPGAAHTFDQAAETHSQAVFSAEITSDQPIAATVIEESSSIMFAYSGFTPSDAATNPVLPLINANNAGYVTGVQIQNTGSSDTSVSVKYTSTDGSTTCTETQSITAKSSATFALQAFNTGANSDCTAGMTLVGGGEITANSTNQPLAAIVNQLKSGVNGEAYNGFNAANATTKVVMPLIMDRNGGYFTGFNVMNVGTTSATVSCTFTSASYTVGGTLAPGQALNDLQKNKIADGYVGSATCTSTGGEIIAVVNELGPSATNDQLLVYEGVNASP